MSTEFDRDPDPDAEEADELRYVGFYNGSVTDNRDPEKLGRVRINIPGLIEPQSAWAFPLGTVGGGSAQRGFYNPPDIGADVGVWFLQGEVDHPFYVTAHWGIPDERETPGPDLSVAPEELVKIKAFETERFLMVWDNRSSNAEWFILDKTNNDIIKISDADGIKAETVKAVEITAATDTTLTVGNLLKLAGPNATESVMKGDKFTTELNKLTSAISGLASAIASAALPLSSGLINPGVAAAALAVVAQASSFTGQTASFLSSKSKTE